MDKKADNEKKGRLVELLETQATKEGFSPSILKGVKYKRETKPSLPKYQGSRSIQLIVSSLSSRS